MTIPVLYQSNMKTVISTSSCLLKLRHAFVHCPSDWPFVCLRLSIKLSIAIPKTEVYHGFIKDDSFLTICQNNC